jgi:hypothetical protein
VRDVPGPVGRRDRERLVPDARGVRDREPEGADVGRVERSGVRDRPVAHPDAGAAGLVRAGVMDGDVVAQAVRRAVGRRVDRDRRRRLVRRAEDRVAHARLALTALEIGRRHREPVCAGSGVERLAEPEVPFARDDEGDLRGAEVDREGAASREVDASVNGTEDLDLGRLRRRDDRAHRRRAPAPVDVVANRRHELRLAAPVRVHDVELPVAGHGIFPVEGDLGAIGRPRRPVVAVPSKLRCAKVSLLPSGDQSGFSS